MKHPLTRLVFGVLCAVVAVARGQIPMSLLMLALAFAMSLVIGVAARFSASMMRLLTPIAISTALMSVAFNTDGPVVWHFVHQGGIDAGLELAVRILGGLSGMVLLFVSTPPADLALGLEQKGLPVALAYLMAASYQLVPAMAKRLQRISTALAARGASFDGPWWQRGTLTASLAVPVIVCELLAAEQRAATLMVRGFALPGKKTSWRELEEHSIEPLVRWLCVLWMIWEMVRVVRHVGA